MAQWQGLGRYPENADPKDCPAAGELLAYVDGSYQDALKKYGFGIIEPTVGMLACKDVGKGKLPDPEVLLDYIAMELAREKTLAGVRVTVTAGPTQESLDPVRYLTNHSSGRMGYAIAREAMLRGFFRVER